MAMFSIHHYVTNKQNLKIFELSHLFIDGPVSKALFQDVRKGPFIYSPCGILVFSLLVIFLGGDYFEIIIRTSLTQ